MDRIIHTAWSVLFAILGGASAAAQATGPRIEIQSAEDAVAGDPLRIVIRGLPPRTEVALASQMLDRYGRLWLAEARYRTTAAGIVDPGAQVPIRAAWRDADPLGPLWSMRRQTKRAYPTPENGNAELMVFSALVADRPVATKSVRRWLRRPGIEELAADTGQMVARIFAPKPADAKNPGRLPAIVIVPGSGGGIPVDAATLFASHGYVAMALAYFGEPTLPKDLERIPLEYFDRAIERLRRHPRVDPRRIAFLGGSKGGELALLVGSRRRDLAAVVAAVPSSVVFQSIAGGWPRTSSWTVAGVDVPFVPYAASPRFRETGQLVHLYADSLQHPLAKSGARIPVQRCGCPILLISGEDDRTWPAQMMCEEIVAHLRRERFPHRIVHLRYRDVGHEVFAPGYRPASWSPTVGGTHQGHGRAQAAAWTATLSFLARILE